jgi:hypothetical protein
MALIRRVIAAAILSSTGSATPSRIEQPPGEAAMSMVRPATRTR